MQELEKGSPSIIGNTLLQASQPVRMSHGGLGTSNVEWLLRVMYRQEHAPCLEGK